MNYIPPESGPVSSFLESDLRDWVRRHGIVVWLDNDDYYSRFVDRLEGLRSDGSLPYDVKSFRGSYLELLLSIESLSNGISKPSLLLHLPKFNEEIVKSTPLLEIYAAGVRYRKRLDTLVTEAAAGKIRPEQISDFKTQGSFTLEESDAWLSKLLNNDSGGLSEQLKAIQLTAILDDLLSAGFIARQVILPQDQAILWNVLESRTGISQAWREATAQSTSLPTADDIAFAIASWALCVEYANDLRRQPVHKDLLPARELPRTVTDACRSLANHLRDRHRAFYQNTADETEELIREEIEAARAEDLGTIDTFRFEEQKVLEAALDALQDELWDAAAEAAHLRLSGGSFWLQEELSRKSAWQLIDCAASLGQAILLAGPSVTITESIDEAVEQYVDKGATVDQKHRQLEQLRVSLLYPQLPEFERIRSALDNMRGIWACWADAWAKDFNEACKKNGFLPSPSMQQRNLFDEIVRPMTKDTGATAYFLVDAFRYEMAEELYQSMRDVSATSIHLKARLAELPTVTEVGMNVLAPTVTNGKLRPTISNGRVQGFSTGEFSVSNPETRRRSMQDRVGGGTCPWLTLEDVVSRESSSLKKAVAKAKLIVVHSQEIDNAGEKGVGPAVFEKVMQKLRAAWRLLRDAGVKRFVITADHGFLLLDSTAATAQSHGRKIDPKRRHVFSKIEADHTNEVRVALASLGYEDTDEHLMFPITTATFDTGNRTMSFVHGGNSLQERVIPVLTLAHRAGTGGSSIEYAIEAAVCEDVAGMHCIGAKVSMTAQQALDFGSPREIELALRVPDSPEITVELCQTRGIARIVRGSIMVVVGEAFEVFFRLKGTGNVRALVELYHPSATAQVLPCVLQTRFSVSQSNTPSIITKAVVGSTEVAQTSWLDQFADIGIRQLFKHLSEHGSVTEAEAVSMLGSQRAFRSFSIKLEQYVAIAPFGVRIDVVSGVKRYVREGWGS